MHMPERTEQCDRPDQGPGNVPKDDISRREAWARFVRENCAACRAGKAWNC